MAPKIQFTKDYVVQTAFELTAEIGLDKLTVRKLADKMGCSVAPIYVNFKNTAELRGAIIEHAYSVLYKFMSKEYSNMPFFNLGIGQILFARDYPKIYLDISAQCQEPGEASSYYDERMIAGMSNDPMVGSLTKEQQMGLLIKMSLMTFAIAFRVAKGDIDINKELDYYINLIFETGYQLIESSKLNLPKDKIKITF